MAVSIEQLANAIRVDNPDDAAVADALAHWLRAAREVVYFKAPDAPIAASDAGILRLAGYLYDQPSASRSSGFANALTNSGALSLIGPWVVRR